MSNIAVADHLDEINDVFATDTVELVFRPSREDYNRVVVAMSNVPEGDTQADAIACQGKLLAMADEKYTKPYLIKGKLSVDQLAALMPMWKTKSPNI